VCLNIGVEILTELSYPNPIIISSDVSKSSENISPREKVVYKTLIEPTVARLEAERNKHKLFLGLLFKLKNPNEIEWVSTEKYYEPFLTVNGRYSIDYYRKREYILKIDKEISEVILLNNTFEPKQTGFSDDHNIKLQGEERIVKHVNAFLFLNKDGTELNIKDFPPSVSDERSVEMIKTFNMPEVPNIEVDAVKKRIIQRPYDLSRLVSETTEIGERSVIYRPIYRVTYKCARLNKVACLQIDGITSKIVRHENRLVGAAKAMLSIFK